LHVNYSTAREVYLKGEQRGTVPARIKKFLKIGPQKYVLFELKNGRDLYHFFSKGLERSSHSSAAAAVAAAAAAAAAATAATACKQMKSKFL
jgi:hypothetical protein